MTIQRRDASGSLPNTGEAVVDVRTGSWSELGADARQIRLAVFVDEQSVPPELELDDADAACLHAVAYDASGLALGTGRLLEYKPGVAKVGRMAVIKKARGHRIGRGILDALINAARVKGYREFVLHAQLNAVSFYLRAGFAAHGPVFEEAGIDHVEMTRIMEPE